MKHVAKQAKFDYVVNVMSKRFRSHKQQAPIHSYVTSQQLVYSLRESITFILMTQSNIHEINFNVLIY
jgi:hypothetical protein